MALSSRTNKVKVDKILVADSNAALATVGTAITALTTDGQIGVYDIDTNLAIDSSYLFTDSPVIYLAQGTGATTATYPLPLRKQEKSSPIDGRYLLSVQKGTYSAPTNNVWIIGETNGQTGEINVADETVYELSIKFDGRRIDILNGRNQPVVFPQFETPDYSVDGPATEVLQRDHLVQNLVNEINQQGIATRTSGAPVIAIAINAGTTGTAASGQTLATVETAGQVITLGYNGDGSAITHTMTAAEAAGVTAARLALVAARPSCGLATTDEVVATLIATPASGTAAASAVTGGTAAVCGTDNNAEFIILIGVDPDLGYFDRIAQTKHRMVVGLRQGFNVSTVGNYEGCKPFEGVGVGRHVNLLYQESDELRKFDTSQPPGAYSMMYNTPVDTTATYNSYTFIHSTPNVATNGLPSVDPFSTTVFIESGDTTTSVAFETLIRTWTASTPSGVIPNF